MLAGYYDTPLVLVSIFIAIVASYSALGLAGRVTDSRGRAMLAWTVGGAIAMGSGIWAMHFVGMLAFQLPIQIAFDTPITMLSLLLPIAASGLALWQVSRADLSRTRLALSALLMGAGINAMHYTGMAALRMQPGIVYDPGLFALSVLVAIGASALALWIAFRLRSTTPWRWLPRPAARAGAAVVLGFAIVGMHYTGMAAASFPAGSVCMAARDGVQHGGLAILVVIASFCLLSLALMASVFETRMEANARILGMSEVTAAEREQVLARERAARDQAEHLSAMKDEFLATLSHELRTPLGAILGWAGMLQRGVKDEATLRRGLDAIERNARAQGQLIDDLLDMSRIVSGTLRLDVQRLDPLTVVEAALGTVQPALLAKQIALHTDLAGWQGELRGDIHGDPGRLQQVLWNLLSNAVKFTPQGGSVQVLLAREGQEVVIRMRDSGIGIAPAFLPYVFDRFRQQDASITRHHGGLGLGLAIARQLVELHGGTIAVDSEGESTGARAGTTFTLRLPLAAPAAASDTAPPAAGRVQALADLSGLKVLLVDDAPDTLEVLEQILVQAGATVMAAASADVALALLAHALPDVIVSDIGMPATDGFELMRRIRQRPSGAGAAIPAIALTALTRKEDRDRALQAGFTDYLAKPVEAAALVACIAALGAHREAAAARKA
jgi:NO-binding membrane sensor protein with MHYT domain/CheY-like chemotaxis protein/nitrogen-specific signal transduction histidine kinase